VPFLFVFVEIKWRCLGECFGFCKKAKIGCQNLLEVFGYWAIFWNFLNIEKLGWKFEMTKIGIKIFEKFEIAKIIWDFYVPSLIPKIPYGQLDPKDYITKISPQFTNFSPIYKFLPKTPWNLLILQIFTIFLPQLTFSERAHFVDVCTDQLLEKTLR
jgi:hypothetical protein